MIEALLSPEGLPFAAALAVVLIFALLEGVSALLGFALSSAVDGLIPDLPDLDLNVDLDAGAATKFLTWLRLGKVPLIFWLIVYLTTFGLLGALLQLFADAALGRYLPVMIAVTAAMIAALPPTRTFASLLAKLIPQDETSAVSADSFVGRVAVVTQGRATHGRPAEARLKDQHGQVHYVRVEPDRATDAFGEGAQVLLVAREGCQFRVIDPAETALAELEG